MTTPLEPPFPSRRAARRSERAQGAADVEQPVPPPPSPGFDPVTQLTGAIPVIPGGRRVAAPAGPPSTFISLPQAPSNDNEHSEATSTADVSGSGALGGHATAAPDAAIPISAQPVIIDRVPPSDSLPVMTIRTEDESPFAPRRARLDATSLRGSKSGNAASSVEAGLKNVEKAPELTMTRRELRALEARQAAERAAQAAGTVLQAGPAPQAGSESKSGHQPQRNERQDRPPVLPEFGPDGALTSAAAAVFTETDFSDDLVEVTDPPSLVEPPPAFEATSNYERTDSESVSSGSPMSPFDSLFQPPSPPPAPAHQVSGPPESSESDVPRRAAPDIGDADASEPEPSVASTPEPESADTEGISRRRAAAAGHWSAQGEVEEDEPSVLNVSRTVSSGISTTSALVLPSIPEGTDIRGPLTSTGEIRLTGSIDLPMALSSSGASDRFDGDNMDALFDLSDGEVVSTDSAPVSAVRAISTRNDSRGITHTQKPKGTRGLTGLLIAASSLAVAVAGLLVAAFALNIF